MKEISDRRSFYGEVSALFLFLKKFPPLCVKKFREGLFSSEEISAVIVFDERVSDSLCHYKEISALLTFLKTIFW